MKRTVGPAICIFCRTQHVETPEQRFRRILEEHLSKYTPAQQERMLDRAIKRLEKGL